MSKRARVQGSHHPVKRPAGTISWKEHLAAWKIYVDNYGRGQSAERINERGGFAWEELCDYFGYEPKTWIANDTGRIDSRIGKKAVLEKLGIVKVVRGSPLERSAILFGLQDKIEYDDGDDIHV